MNTADPFFPLLADLEGLTVFTALKEHILIRKLRKLLRGVLDEPEILSGEYVLEISASWAAFIREYSRSSREASFYEKTVLLTAADDNEFTRTAELCGRDCSSNILYAAARTDLQRLGRIAQADIPALGRRIAEMLGSAGLADQKNAADETCAALAANLQTAREKHPAMYIFVPGRDWGAALPAFAEYLRSNGAGILGAGGAFYWQKDKTGKSGLIPVLNPDPIRPADLSGYEDQRSMVVSNTLRFLEGKPAGNLLLYGDRGTGKSATVKAVCNEYTRRGLRLVEVRKRDLLELPAILDTLAVRALRFVLFIDDLSFEQTDDSFTTLKALLEGGIEAKPGNVVVYATSNRRHLVKERFSDRPSMAAAAEAHATGDVRAFDTMQEQLSLADRFGVTVVFTAPDQDEYLRIAEFLAEHRGLLPEETGESGDERKRFRENALRWERWFNGRSPRTAVQYVDWVAGGSDFPWE
ncbi:ATP-binding protein [Breznakiella homolactica]|uniref:ATP-binding protein n=1 Tax=Breznakiella homolactica TaxID=2798577 RepID=A0A7T7XPP9_9SPIR|nr:ATP-binding protein [Breznakiella homolactica]QQO10246.1 ATP-binding protein [Breznakiella homolactica]